MYLQFEIDVFDIYVYRHIPTKKISENTINQRKNN